MSIPPQSDLAEKSRQVAVHGGAAGTSVLDVAPALG